ncbi:hypothetical protein L9F63_014892, partial [Diploptera punctata]
MDKFDTVYVSTACSRTPHSADWGRNNLICYAASHSVTLYDPEYAGAGKVTFVLCQHKDRVNSVRWIRCQNGISETELVSASTDCTAIIWTKTNEGSFSPSSVLKGHQSAVTIADGIYISGTKSDSCKLHLIVATASVDSTVKIWRRSQNKEDAVCVQTLSFGSGFCLTLNFAYLPGTDIALLACAADDAKIHLFAENTDSEINEKHFVKVNTLVGHEDWIRAMDFAMDDSGELLLASSSQDSLIRLWRIAPRDEEIATRIRKKINELDISEDIQLEEKFFTVKVHNNDSVSLLHFAVSLESVLTGHEGWVYGVSWHPPVYSTEKKKFIQPMKLLSSSLDKTIIIWEPDEESGVWLESVRVGEVGGNTLGFYGSKFGPDGLRIMGHGYQGSFHLWSFSKNSGAWEPDVTVGGHFGEVVDMQWEPGGQFLLSVSSDQTTRLHAPWVRQAHQEVTWHELARPQVHGYDMSCIAVLSRYRFASGAEEKVIRAFQAPNNFVDNFYRIWSLCLLLTRSMTSPQGASVPALGLSNKAVYEAEEMLPEERHVKDEYPEIHDFSLILP